MSELIATVEQDFEYDLEDTSRPDFPFRNLVKDNDEYKGILFNQFKELPATPKYNWYSQDRLANGYLTEEEKYRWDNRHGTGILFSDVESKLNDLVNEFHKNHKHLDSKYNGRNLLSTPLVKTLNQIGEQIKDFEKFVSSDKTLSTEKYAEAFASEFIATTDKLNTPLLKKEILDYFINKTENNDLLIDGIVSEMMNKYLYRKTDTLESEYKKLKIYANRLLREEMLKDGIAAPEINIQERTTLNGTQNFL